MKFLFDKTISFLGLILLSPVLAVIALLIRIMMPGGPVLFRQERVGKDGKSFTIHKFRTMEEEQVTGLGKILRRFKLDELPQLWNILKGEMSFVGPRPDVPGYADALTGEDREILSLRPGITGPASLKYRDEEDLLARVEKELSEGREFFDPEGRPVLSALEYNDRVIFPDKVRINRYYLHHQSVLSDLKIIIATILHIKLRYDGEVI